MIAVRVGRIFVRMAPRERLSKCEIILLSRYDIAVVLLLLLVTQLRATRQQLELLKLFDGASALYKCHRTDLNIFDLCPSLLTPRALVHVIQSMQS